MSVSTCHGINNTGLHASRIILHGLEQSDYFGWGRVMTVGHRCKSKTMAFTVEFICFRHPVMSSLPTFKLLPSRKLG